MLKSEIKILIIENGMDEVRLILETIEKADLKTISAQYANSLSFGMKLLRKEKFDLVILDLALPDCVGFEPIKKLRKDYPEIPIIVLTGLDEKLKARALLLGVNSYLVKKQTNTDTLLKTIYSTIS
jgi:DNA-binding response OmpR family regulator